MGFMLVPEFFLIVMVYKITSLHLDQMRMSWWIWFAFLGGLLWDLRWSSSPGMSPLINTVAMTLVYWIWDRTPIGGRSALLLAALAGGAHLASGMVHYLAWAVPSMAAARMFLIQQLLAVPVLIVLCTIYTFNATDTRV